MKRLFAATLSLILLAGSLCACTNQAVTDNGSRQTPDSSAENPADAPEKSESNNLESNETANVCEAAIPEELSEIPEAYFSLAENPGMLAD